MPHRIIRSPKQPTKTLNLAIARSTSAFLIATTALHIATIVAVAIGVFVFLWGRTPDIV